MIQRKKIDVLLAGAILAMSMFLGGCAKENTKINEGMQAVEKLDYDGALTLFEQAIVEQQCMNANKARRVEEGYVTAAAFFQKAKGDILISGKYGCDKRMLYEMIKEYKNK